MASVALLALGAVLFLAHSGPSAPLSVGLIAKEFMFDPKDVVVGSGEIAFIVKNQGAIEHNLVLEVPGGKTVTQIAIIEPGQTTKVTVSLPSGVFQPFTGIKTSILLFSKGGSTNHPIWCYQLSADGRSLDRKRRVQLEQNDIPDLLIKYYIRVMQPVGEWPLSCRDGYGRFSNGTYCTSRLPT